MRNPWIRGLVFLACLVPLADLLLRFQQERLGPNPVEFITHATGTWALRFLVLSLAVTPLRRWRPLVDLIVFRRMWGLFAFFYASLHFTTWFWLDKALDPAEMWTDVLKRRYITAGMLSLVVMIPLAVTSTQGWIRRLGKRWRLLHRLAYVSAVAGVVHFFWLVKSDIREPAFYGACVAALLGWRLLMAR